MNKIRSRQKKINISILQFIIYVHDRQADGQTENMYTFKNYFFKNQIIGQNRKGRENGLAFKRLQVIAMQTKVLQLKGLLTLLLDLTLKWHGRQPNPCKLLLATFTKHLTWFLESVFKHRRKRSECFGKTVNLYNKIYHILIYLSIYLSICC